MCTGFGLIVSKELQVYFIEPAYSGNCSHSDILERLGWKENGNKFLRNFVRVEYPDWTADSFRFDEESTLPGWAENSRDDIRAKCESRLSLCAAARAEYERVRAAAWAEFEKVRAPALAEYDKVRAPAYAELITTFSRIEGYVPRA